MGKRFRNKFKTFKHASISGNRKQRASHSANAGKFLKRPFTSGGVEDFRGAQPQAFKTEGKILNAIGVATAQPELVAVGTGLQGLGEGLEGDDPRKIFSDIGAGLGQQFGGTLGESAGRGIGGEFGGSFTDDPERQTKPVDTPEATVRRKPETKPLNVIRPVHSVGGKIHQEESKSLENAIDDRTHHDQLLTQIGENSHRDDKNTHHHNVSIPTGLTALGGSLSGVGETAQMDRKDVADNKLRELENQIPQQNTVLSLLELASDNIGVIEALAEGDRNRVLDEILDSGLLENLVVSALSV